MNTAAALFCQTAGRGKFAGWARLLPAAVGWLFLCTAGRGAPAEPPVWQRELDALCLFDAAIALLPPARGTEADRRLGELFRQLTARYPGEAVVHRAAGDHFWRTGEAETAIAEWRGASQGLNPVDTKLAKLRAQPVQIN